MKPLRTTLLSLAAILILASPTWAADPAAILGDWIEQLPSGGGMVTEFAADSITAYGVNAAGERISTPMTEPVTYRDLGKTIGVDFKNGGGALVAVQTPTSIILDFPDAGSHNLIRWTRTATASVSKAPKP